MQLSPLAHLVQGQADIVHYLKRLQHHLSVHRERLFELQIDKTINDVFAKVTIYLIIMSCFIVYIYHVLIKLNFKCQLLFFCYSLPEAQCK